MSRRIIIPKGLVNPAETTIIEIPEELEAEQELIASAVSCRGSQFGQCSGNRTTTIPGSPSIDFSIPQATSTPRGPEDDFTYSTLEDSSLARQQVFDMSPERTLSTTDESSHHSPRRLPRSSFKSSRSMPGVGAIFNQSPRLATTQNICPAGRTFDAGPPAGSRTFNAGFNLGRTQTICPAASKTFDAEPPVSARTFNAGPASRTFNAEPPITSRTFNTGPPISSRTFDAGPPITARTFNAGPPISSRTFDAGSNLGMTQNICPAANKTFDAVSSVASRTFDAGPRATSRTFNAGFNLGITQNTCPAAARTFNAGPPPASRTFDAGHAAASRTFNVNLGRTFNAAMGPPPRMHKTFNATRNLGATQILSQAPQGNVTYDMNESASESSSFHIPLATSTPKVMNRSGAGNTFTDTPFTYSTLYDTSLYKPSQYGSSSPSGFGGAFSFSSDTGGTSSKTCPCSGKTRSSKKSASRNMEASPTFNSPLATSTAISMYRNQGGLLGGSACSIGSLCSRSNLDLSPYKDIGRTRAHSADRTCNFGVLGNAYLAANMNETPPPHFPRNQSVVEDIQSELHEIEDNERVQLEDDLKSYQQARRTLMSNTAFTFGERSTNVSEVTGSSGSRKCKSRNPSGGCQ